MMLPQIIENHLARIEEKKSIICNPVVISSLNRFEILAAKASIGKPIMSYHPEELRKRVAAMVLVLMKDLGIRTGEIQDNQYYGKRFYDILRDYYSNFTLDQIDKAFQLLLCGALDEFLPRDKYGNPDRHHYQSFSMEFITKVLRAFQQYNNRVWSKAQKALPEPEKIITEEEKKEAREGFINMVRGLFEDWKEGKEIQILFPRTVADYLVELGWVEPRELTESDYNKALLQVKSNPNHNGLMKKLIVEAFNTGDRTKVESEAENVKAESMVIQAFERIKKENGEI